LDRLTADSFGVQVLMAAKHLRVWGAAGQLLIVTTDGAAAAKPKEDHANALYTPIERFVRCHQIGSCPSDRREGSWQAVVRCPPCPVIQHDAPSYTDNDFL
jgi:hypothetical protein